MFIVPLPDCGLGVHHVNVPFGFPLADCGVISSVFPLQTVESQFSVLLADCGFIDNRRFPEITGKDNLTLFSYSGRVKSPEWRRQRRRADLRPCEIFRHGPIIIYATLPAGGTYYPICMFPTNSERLIGIADAFSVFVYGYPSSCPRAHCTPNKSVPTLRYTRRPGPFIQAMPVGTYRVQSPGLTAPCIIQYVSPCQL